MEIWKDVEGFEGLYEVSSHGLIRTKEGKETHTSRHGKRRWKSRVLKDKTPKGRDYRVDLWINGKGFSFLAHRLVAIAFIPKIEGKNFVNHKDGNPKNNNVENLEWVDHKENNNHAFDNGLINTGKKIKLTCLKCNKEYNFRSIAKASLFIGLAERSLHRVVSKKGSCFEYKGFKVEKR